MAEKRKATSGKGKRLTERQKVAIANAPSGVTNTELAEKYKTTLQTVGRYRKGAKGAAKAHKNGAKPGRPAGSTGGVNMQVDEDFIILKIPKKNLLKGLVGELFQ